MSLLRAEQAAFDARYFDPPRGYVKLPRMAQKAEHIGAHLGKITGRKLIHWADDGWETPDMREGVLREVIPDLCIYRTQLAECSGIDDDRLVAAADALRPGLLAVYKRSIHTSLVRARGKLDDYTEPMRHGASGDNRLVQDAAIILHFAVRAAAENYGITDELEDMHRARLTEQAAYFDALEAATPSPVVTDI